MFITPVDPSIVGGAVCPAVRQAGCKRGQIAKYLNNANRTRPLDQSSKIAKGNLIAGRVSQRVVRRTEQI